MLGESTIISELAKEHVSTIILVRAIRSGENQ